MALGYADVGAPFVGHLDGDMGLTNKIKKAMYDVANTYLYIGFLLHEAQMCKYYAEKGYRSIYEYAEKELQFKKSSVCNFVAVYKTFSDDGKMFMKHEFKRFNYSQLVEMLSLSPRQRSEITPDMPVSQIRKVKKAALGGTVESDSTTAFVQTSGQQATIPITIGIPKRLYMELANTCGLTDTSAIAQHLLEHLEALAKQAQQTA